MAARQQTTFFFQMKLVRRSHWNLCAFNNNSSSIARVLDILWLTLYRGGFPFEMGKVYAEAQRHKYCMNQLENNLFLVGRINFQSSHAIFD